MARRSPAVADATSPPGVAGADRSWQTGRSVAWLICNGTRVAPLEMATLPWQISRGLLGRDGIEGAVLLVPAFVIHTIGMRFPIDVAFCDGRLRVVATVTMGRHRLSLPRVRARSVLEASAGAFAIWRLTKGSQLAIEDG